MCIATTSPKTLFPTFGLAAIRSTDFLLKPPPMAASYLENPLLKPIISHGDSMRCSIYSSISSPKIVGLSCSPLPSMEDILKTGFSAKQMISSKLSSPLMCEASECICFAVICISRPSWSFLIFIAFGLTFSRLIGKLNKALKNSISFLVSSIS